MPVTRRASARNKMDNSDEENEKENIHEKRSNARKSKLKSPKTIVENRDHSCSFISTQKPPDTFDLLYSSPMKQEVNFKPLSFWSKKVKDLEMKENVKKKKCELYELSETDESFSSQENNLGKKPKKKGRITVGRQKNKRTVKKVTYDFNKKNLAKRQVVKSRVDNKEGSLIRERIILRRLNEKFMDVEDKFSFKKVTALGLTSTPGKSKNLNVVGGSTFHFLSPIPIPEDISKLTHELHSDLQGKACKSKENLPDSVENKTPKRLRKTRAIKKMVTKDLKWVSGNGRPVGDYLENSFTEFDSFTKNIYMGESVGYNFCSTENCESEFESFPLNCGDTVLDLSSFIDSQDEMNKSFLHVTDYELNEEMGVEIENEIYPKEDPDPGNSFNSSSTIHEQVIRTPFSLKFLLKSDDSRIKLTAISSGECRSFPDLTLLSATLPVGENRTLLRTLTNFGFDEESPLVEDESSGSVCRNSSTPTSSVDRRNSFSNVTVRRYYNVFLNFRRSANKESFELPRNVNNLNQENFGDDSCPDFLNGEILHASQSVKKDSFSFDYNLPKVSDIDNCDSNDRRNTQVGWLSLSQIGSKDHQINEKPIVEVSNYKIGSNQYRSKEVSANQIEDHIQIYSDLGNDSSVVVSSPETRNTFESVNCSLCKPEAVKEWKEEPDLVAAATETEPKSIREISYHANDFNTFRAGSRSKCYTRARNQSEGREVGGESKIFSSSSVESVIMENAVNDISLSDELDFPLPIFESTACTTPTRERRNGRNINVSAKKMPVENIVQKTSIIPAHFGEQDLSTVTSLPSCRLKPGKKWARSAVILKKTLNGTLLLNQTTSTKKRGKMYQTFVEEVLSMQNDVQDPSLMSTIDSNSTMIAITNKMSDLALTIRGTIGNRTVKVLKESIEHEEMDCSFRSIFRDSNEKCNSAVVNFAASYHEQELTSREKHLMSARTHVLMRCNQEAPLPFEEYFNEMTLKNCKKIGEGTFGEVFMCNTNRVIKVMPIEGPDEVNGERQKKFDEILSEIVIATELSNLRSTDKYKTSGFCELKRCWCVEGKYPSYLIDLWNDFDRVGRGSENDSPVMFKPDQLYIVLEFGNGGKDLEAFVFTSAEQSLSVLFQVACSLAVAENVLQFEHRDMHWGNILIAPTKEKYFSVTINDEVIKIPTKGVKVTIIDFTLSRISYDGCCLYNDLSADPTLFTSEGDYQFEIYRMMKREVMNDWSLFRPKTNIFWLHYVADKMVKMVRYKKTNTKVHKIGLKRLNEIKSVILKYADSEDFATNCDFE